MRLCVSILVAVILTVISVNARRECDDQLEVNYGAVDPKTYKVEFTLANAGKDDVCVAVWETFLDPLYWPAAVTLEVKSGDEWKELTYDKPVFPIYLGLDDLRYQCIKGNSQVRVTCDLSAYFSFEEKKEYRFKMMIYFWDCYKTDNPGECKQAPDRYEDFHLPDGTKEVIQEFTAEVSKSNAKVAIQNWLVDEQIQQKPYKQSEDLKTVIAFGVTAEEFDTIKAAHTKAKEYFTKAVELLSGVPDDNDELNIYIDWFGYYNEARYKKILKNFQVCLRELDEPHIYVTVTPQMCPVGGYAFTNAWFDGKKKHLINFCPLFFQKIAEQVPTLVHEMTHDSAKTIDVKNRSGGKYSTAQRCKDLAKNRPDKAIKNAENYSRFAKAAYIYDHLD